MTDYISDIVGKYKEKMPHSHANLAERLEALRAFHHPEGDATKIGELIQRKILGDPAEGHYGITQPHYKSIDEKFDYTPESGPGKDKLEEGDIKELLDKIAYDFVDAIAPGRLEKLKEDLKKKHKGKKEEFEEAFKEGVASLYDTLTGRGAGTKRAGIRQHAELLKDVNYRTFRGWYTQQMQENVAALANTARHAVTHYLIGPEDIEGIADEVKKLAAKHEGILELVEHPITRSAEDNAQTYVALSYPEQLQGLEEKDLLERNLRKRRRSVEEEEEHEEAA